MDDPGGQQGEPPSAEGILAEGEQAELRAQVAETTAKPPDFGKAKSHKKTPSQGGRASISHAARWLDRARSLRAAP